MPASPSSISGRRISPALIDKARAGLAATLAVGADAAPLNLVVEIDPDLPEFVADGTRIVQVLYNLLSSAARYSRDGSVVHLKVTRARTDRILFIVEDEGIVFPDEVKREPDPALRRAIRPRRASAAPGSA